MDETNVGKFIGELIGKGKTVNYQKVGSVHSLTVEQLVVEVRYPDIAMMVQLSARTFKECGPVAALHELETKVQALKDKLIRQGENQ